MGACDGAPHSELMLADVHAIPAVWARQLFHRAQQLPGSFVSATDGVKMSHPTDDIGQRREREQELFYTTFAPLARLLADDVDARSSLYMIDVAGAQLTAAAHSSRPA